MSNNYKNIFDKKVMTEKTKIESNLLVIYLQFNPDADEAFMQYEEQEKEGINIATRYELKHCLVETSYFSFDADNILQLKLVYYLRSLITNDNKIRHFFFHDINLLSKNKIMVAFIVSYLSSCGFIIYDKNGIVDYSEIKKIKGTVRLLRDYEIFLQLMEPNNVPQNLLQNRI